MSEYQKTAKDIAWDKERQKFRTTISKLQSDIVNLSSQIAADQISFQNYENTIEEQKRTIELLQEKMNLSDADLKTLVEHERKQQEAFDTFKSLSNFHGLGQYTSSI